MDEMKLEGYTSYSKSFVIFNGAKELCYGTMYSSGFDVRSTSPSFILQPNETQLVETGVSIFTCPIYVDITVRPKSSMSLKGLLVHIGTIDADYRLPIKVCITNISGVAQQISFGQKVAQIVVGVKHPSENVHIARAIVERTGGFGSTGND